MGTETKDVMTTFRQKSGKKKKIIIAIVVVLIALFTITNSMRKQAAAMEDAISAMQQTDVVSKRSLVKSIGATGKIVSLKSKNITANLTGTKVENVAVAIGDTVEEGTLLLTFDTTDIEENLENAKNSLSKAQERNALSKSDAERNYDTQISNAKKNLDSAAEYYAAVADYIYVLETGLNGLSGEALAAQEAKIATYKAKLEPAREAYETQQKNYENVLAAQESSLSATLLNLDTTSQEAQVELYQEQLANATLCAPFSGVVTAINYEAGDTYSGGAIITLQDCSSFEIEAQIGEYDISDIKIGQRVLIKTNATADEEMEGTINFISPTATNSAASAAGGDVNYAIRISINNPSDRLRLDMSASLSIIIEEHDDVLTVPYNAVQTREDGSTFVSVKNEDGSFREVAINVIMESNYYTEITSNELSEGSEVLIVDTGDASFMDMFSRRGGF